MAEEGSQIEQGKSLGKAETAQGNHGASVESPDVIRKSLLSRLIPRSLKSHESSEQKAKTVGINLERLFGKRERVRPDDIWGSITPGEWSAYERSILGEESFQVVDPDERFVSILQKSREIRTDGNLRLSAARLVGEGVSAKSVIEVMEKGTLASDEAVDEVFRKYIGHYVQARELFTTEDIEGLWIGKSVLDTARNLESRGIPKQAIYAILKKTDSWKSFVGSSKLSDEDLRVLFPEIKTAINLTIPEDFRNLRHLHVIEESLGKQNPALEEVLENLGLTGPVKNIGVELLDDSGEYKSVFKVAIAPETGKEKVIILKIYKSAVDHHTGKSETIYEDVQEFKVIKSLESTGAAQKIYTKEPVFVDYLGKRQMSVFEEFLDGQFVEAFREADTGTIKAVAFAYGENVAKIWNGTKITVDDMEKGAIPEDNFLHNTFFVSEDGRWVAKTFDFTTDFTGYGKLEDAVAWKIETLIAELAGVSIVTEELTVPGDPAVVESYLLGVTSQLGEKRNEFLQRLLSTIEKGRGSDYPPLKNIREAVRKLTGSPHETVK